MNADPPPPPPPWVWMVPGSAGLLRLGAGVAPPPVLLASAQPPAGPPLPGLPAWRAPGESLLPLLPLPAAPDHAAAAAAAAAHRYPALNGQVTRPRPRPRARGGRRPPGPGRRPRPHSRGPGPVARTHPSRGGPRAPSPPGRSLQPCVDSKVHAPTSRSASGSFCKSFFLVSRWAVWRPAPQNQSRDCPPQLWPRPGLLSRARC